MSIRQQYLNLFVCAFMSAPLQAQSLSPDVAIDTIIVSASRSPLERAAVGSATTVISRDQIEMRQSRYVTDVLRSVPGFSVSQSGAVGSQTQVRVRGAEANHVLVLIDGIRANDPATGDEFRWEYLTTGNVERIEIVRGPQSSLWGSDAIAAVVNVITRTGNGPPRLGVYAEGGSNETLNAGLNGGTRGDNWSMGFGVERLKTAGTNISRSGNEDDGSDVLTASVSGSIQASERMSFNFGMRAVDAHSEVDPTDYFTTGLPIDADHVNEGAQTYAQVGAMLQGRFTHQLNARYLATNSDNFVDDLKDSSTKADRITFSYQADISLADDLLSLAVEQEETDFAQRGAIIFGDPNQDQSMSVSSVIADYRRRASDDLTWLFSIRYDDNSDFDSVTTGRASVSWQATSATRLRVNLGTGQKAPTFVERFGYFPGQFVGNPGLEPETSTSFDVGIDHQFGSEILSVGLTLFRQDLQNEIDGFVFDPNTFLSTAENRTEDSERNGIELEAKLTPSDWFEFNASYTYTDSNETNLGIDTNELRRPKHSGHLAVMYRLPAHKANVMLAADYGGTRSDIFFPPFPNPSEIVTLDNFWLVDLTTAYDLSATMSIFARINNLLDENYEQVFGFATPGRSAFVGFRTSFGH